MGKAVDSRVRTRGPDHPDTLTIRYKLAFLSFHLTLGDLQLAAAGHAELVVALRGIAADLARVLGSAHPDTLQSWDMLARHCPEPERPGLRERVVHGWEQVLAERERRLGPDDPETLAVLLQLVAQHRPDPAGRPRNWRYGTHADLRVNVPRAGMLGPPRTVTSVST